MDAQGSTEEMGMAAQAAMNKKNKISKAKGEEVNAELPIGSAQVEASSSEPAPETQSVTEALGEELKPEVSVEVLAEKVKEEDDEPIRIAGKTFKNQKEAFEWAEKVEQERLLAEAHALGVREALAAQQTQAQVLPKEEEEDFETKFYSNPKETLKEMQIRARDEAVAMIRAETAKEKAWNEFLSEYPDIRRQDAEAILQTNTSTIGRLPWDEGRKALAQAVYREYDEIANLRRPKTELTNKKPVLSPSGGIAKGVTPKQSDEKTLSFAEQLRKIKSKG